MKKLFFTLIIGLTFTACEKDEVAEPNDDTFMTERCKCGYFQSGLLHMPENYSTINIVNNCSGVVKTFRIEGGYSHIEYGDDHYCSTQPW